MSKRDGWRRVSRRNPCPICSKPDNCSVSDDDVFVICGREANGSVRDYGNSWLHVLHERERDDWQPSRQAAKPAIPEAPLAPIERRHAAYTALLELLTLTERHSSDLLRRGLHDTTIARELYATVPAPSENQFIEPGQRIKPAELAARLATHFNLSGVPGFYGGGEDEFEAYIQLGWLLNVSDWYAGYFVPFRDLAGRIQALQIRRDSEKERYRWLTSRERPGGVSSGAPMHFAAPHRLKSGSVIITEGALKAEIIAQFTGVAVIGLAGVGNFKPGLGEALKALHVKRVQIAFDADYRSKPHVRHELKKLGQLLSTAGLAVSVLNWNLGTGKGLDDVLAKEAA